MSVRIGFTGDVVSHLGFVIKEMEGQPFADAFTGPVRALCQAQDEMWGNLEGPVSESTDGLGIYLRAKRGRATYPKLFFPRHYIPPLVALNFRVLGVANNHSFDFETAHDTEDTSRRLAGHGIGVPGVCFDPVIREIHGLSFAVIATTSFLNPPGGRRVARITDGNRATLMRTVRRWSRRVDHVVVMTHWGCDYGVQPDRHVRALARELLDAGARVVYGNHPHVLWPIEQPAPDRLVCYSLGNFCEVPGCMSCEAYPYSKGLYGGLVSAEFTRDSVRAAFFPLVIRHNYRDWLREVGLDGNYANWTARELRQWQTTLPERTHRLFSRVEQLAPAQSVPLHQADIEALYPWSAGRTGGRAPGRGENGMGGRGRTRGCRDSTASGLAPASARPAGARPDAGCRAGFERGQGVDGNMRLT